MPTGTLYSYVRVRYGADTLIRSGVHPSEAHQAAHELNASIANRAMTADELRKRLLQKTVRSN